MDGFSRRVVLVSAAATMLVIGLVWAGTAMLGERRPSASASVPSGGSDTVDYGSGITTRPAVGMVAALTADDALARAGRIDMPRELTPGTPAVALRSVTITTGSSADGDQPSKKVDSALAWVLVYDNSPADVHGPATLPAERRDEIVADSNCSFIVILDANTGETLALKQRCVPR